MRLAIVAVGRMKDGPERGLCARYVERSAALASRLGFSGPDIVELPEGRQRTAQARRANEARAILAVATGHRLILLDETGRSFASAEFADRLARLRDSGERGAAFVIGGADGLDAAMRDRAAESLAFGRATLPHQLVRILVAEQVYRAMTILAGHPYHRGS